MSEERSNDDMRWLASSLALAFVLWPIGFHLGAYGTILYTDQLKIWVASIVMIMLRLFGSRSKAQGSIGSILILLIPSIAWFLEFLSNWYRSPAIETLGTLAWMFATFLSLPYIGLRLLQIFFPEVSQERLGRRRILMVAVPLFVAICTFAIGKYNALFLYCEDFAIAGDALPKNCYSGALSSEAGSSGE